MRTGFKTVMGRIQGKRAAKAMTLLAHMEPPQLASKPLNDQVLLTVTGEPQLPQLFCSLLSLYVNSDTLPHVSAVSDLKTPGDVIARAVSWWPGPLTVLDGQSCARRWEISGQEKVAAFARRHLHGLKFGIIREIAASRPVLYADTDTLWFRPMTGLVEKPAGRVHIRMSQDLSYSYDMNLLRQLTDQDIGRRCAGVMYVSGDVLECPVVQRGLDCVLAGESHPYWAEQTLFAVGSAVLGYEPWPMSEVRYSYSDYWFPRPWPRLRQALRHYPGYPMRDLFWVHGWQMAKRACRNRCVHPQLTQVEQGVAAR